MGQQFDIRNSFLHGFKANEVKFEGSNEGTWESVTERSRGFVVLVGFGKEELDWLIEHLKKVVELEASRGFIRKTKTHLMEICFNNRGQWWEDLRKAIFSVQEYSDQAGGASKETFGDTQMSKGIYRVAGHTQKWLQRMDIGMEFCCQLENGPELRVEWFQEQGRLLVKGRSLKFILKKWGRVTKVARESLKLADLSKVKLWVEMLPNVVLPALLEVEDGAWTFTVQFQSSEKLMKTTLSRLSQPVAGQVVESGRLRLSMVKKCRGATR
ncbi:hypothetical protein CK203_095171 [Vitis vinifera]|uniref:DUF4283 domain-containing protein n=1 Tax=Vitis vinifera TaxID=29760 RepID=A0A438C7D6_VITVI|nr:hypothetical protein CK203_095171 [Vitis vinifera]